MTYDVLPSPESAVTEWQCYALVGSFGHLNAPLYIILFRKITVEDIESVCSILEQDGKETLLNSLTSI